MEAQFEVGRETNFPDPAPGPDPTPGPASDPDIDTSSQDFESVGLEKELRFDAVCFRYDKTRTGWILNGIDMVIPANAMTAIAGQSGAGKSSIADLILGLLTPDQGQIYTD